MTITTRTAKGSALTIAELDGNFTDLNGRVAALEAAVDDPPPMEIDSDVTGNQWTLTINGDDFVMTIPQASYAPPAVVTNASGSITLSDLMANTYTRCTNATAVTITIHPQTDVPIPIGSEFHFRQAGAGLISVVEASSSITTINPPSTGASNVTTGRGDTITLKKVGSEEWDYIGPSS